MYEELVERLRTCGNSLSCNKCKWSSNCGGAGEVLRKAADAIEGLSGLVDHYGGETGLKNLREYADKYWDLLKKFSEPPKEGERCLIKSSSGF